MKLRGSQLRKLALRSCPYGDIYSGLALCSSLTSLSLVNVSKIQDDSKYLLLQYCAVSYYSFQLSSSWPRIAEGWKN